MSNLNEYWCRWTSTMSVESFEYHGPWWISGYSSYGNPTICAAICAESEEEALKAFCSSYDKAPLGLLDFSCDPLKMSDPFTSRFPKRDWMIWPITPKEAMERRSS